MHYYNVHVFGSNINAAIKLNEYRMSVISIQGVVSDVVNAFISVLCKQIQTTCERPFWINIS